MDDIKRILTAVDNGDSQAASQLLPLVYEDLKRLAERQMAQETPGHTLSATALVHEAYLRLMGSADNKWDHRGRGGPTISGCDVTFGYQTIALAND